MTCFFHSGQCIIPGGPFKVMADGMMHVSVKPGDNGKAVKPIERQEVEIIKGPGVPPRHLDDAAGFENHAGLRQHVGRDQNVSDSSVGPTSTPCTFIRPSSMTARVTSARPRAPGWSTAPLTAVSTTPASPAYKVLKPQGAGTGADHRHGERQRQEAASRIYV